MATLLGVDSERIYQSILREIEFGDLALHSKLPTEFELCQRFKVSRNTVRKAIQRLIEDGLVTSRQGAGSYVTSSTGEKTAKIISIMFQGDSTLLKTCQKLALNNEYLLSVFSHESKKWLRSYEEKFLRQVLVQRHRLLVAFCTPMNPNIELLEELKRANVRVIHVDPYHIEKLPENYIMADYYRAGYMAGVNLMIAGYTHCYFGGLLTDGPYSIIQERGFLDALKDQGNGNGERVMLKDDPLKANYFQLWKDPDHRDIMEYIGRFVKEKRCKPAVFCALAHRAKFLIETLNQLGLNVPGDVGVISTAVRESPQDEQYPGFDLIEFNRYQFYKKAIEIGIKESFSGIQKLVQPKLVKGNTVGKV